MEKRIEFLVQQLLDAQTSIEVEARGGYEPDIVNTAEYLTIVDVSVNVAMW